MARIVFKIVFLCKLIALVTSGAIKDESLAKIIESENIIDEKGNYVFRFETSNGLTRFEEGNVVNDGEPNEHIEVIGSYSYLNDDGARVIFQYTAGEEGYQQQLKQQEFQPLQFPSSVSSAIPPVILASLAG